jgi:hypothetical protein
MKAIVKDGSPLWDATHRAYRGWWLRGPSNTMGNLRCRGSLRLGEGVHTPKRTPGNRVTLALALGLDGSVASAPVTVEVRRNSTIESLQLEGTSRTMLFPGHDQLHVRAMFSAGILRDVTDPGLGTTYSSDDESIVSVSAAGMMTAKRLGVTVVTVRNGAAEASTFVLVVPTPGARAELLCHELGKHYVRT